MTDQEHVARSGTRALRGWLPIVGLLGLAVALVVGAPLLIRPDPARPTPSATDALAWVSDLAGQLECDGEVARIGGEVPNPDMIGLPGDTPEAGLALFLGPNNPYAALPAAGYDLLHGEGHWASFAHVVGDEPKAIIVLTDTPALSGDGGGWVVIGLRACDPSEFDPDVPLTFPVTVWTDTTGAGVSTDTIRSLAGPDHCGWASVIFLRFDGQTYFRDPEGVMGAVTTSAFEVGVALPSAAIDTGYRQGTQQLWIDPGADAYVVSNDVAERWPRSNNPSIACL
ncbi:MAG: hypothetical protein AB1736_13305 [Chloroflexota bacterium]